MQCFVDPYNIMYCFAAPFRRESEKLFQTLTTETSSVTCLQVRHRVLIISGMNIWIHFIRIAVILNHFSVHGLLYKSAELHKGKCMIIIPSEEKGCPHLWTLYVLKDLRQKCFSQQLFLKNKENSYFNSIHILIYPCLERRASRKPIDL